jgi:hypothetical protein
MAAETSIKPLTLLQYSTEFQITFYVLYSRSRYFRHYSVQYVTLLVLMTEGKKYENPNSPYVANVF